MAKGLSKSKLQKAATNRKLFLSGKPFLLPRRLDIHRKAYALHISSEENKRKYDTKDTMIFEEGFMGGRSIGNYTKAGRIWLDLEERWLNKTMKTSVGFHELDFDIEVDNMGRVSKEINGEIVEVKYDTKY